MTTQPIRFFHRGAVVEVGDAEPTRTVLDWLREDARCTGTKEGCNEGDCGACTVVIGALAADATADAVGGLELTTTNACIQFLPTLHGKALFTVEDLQAQCALQSPDGKHKKHAVLRLHPVQQALVDCHGSQCGFCTPGFVMSLWSVYEQGKTQGTVPTRQRLADELSGNLCRCTGYRPILDAGQRMFDLPDVRLDTTAAVAALRGLQRDSTFTYAGAREDGEGHRFQSPVTVAELAALRVEHPQATLLAGCTDIGLWVNKQFRDLGDIIHVGDVTELKTIEDTEAGLCIGAGASLESAWTALARRVPSLEDVWLRFASPPIRHAGTMGGNVANGSPIGDAPPVLMALDAQIVLRRGDRVRRMPLADFYVDYMKNQLEAGEFVQALEVPTEAMRRRVRAYKISKRFDSDISALCAAFAIELDGDKVGEVRLAFGGMAGTVKRAARAEAALVGQAWDQAAVDRAKAALAQDFQPLSDMRASAEYRMRVAQNLLTRFWLETRADDPLAAASTSVFSVMPHATA